MIRMPDIAVVVRIFEPEPTDDLVEKRGKAIKEIAARFAKRKNVAEILQLANELALSVAPKGALAPNLATEIEAAIKKESTSFVKDGEDLQIMACALAASLQHLEGASPSRGPVMTTDLFAAALWSALSFQSKRSEPKLETLRGQLLLRAQQLVSETSSSARKRLPVPDVTIKLPEGADWTKVPEITQAATSKTIESLRSNGALDREELDILWWVLSDWSTLLKARLSGLAPALSVVAAGLEVARLLRRLPGDAHKHLVLRSIPRDESLTLAQLLGMLEDKRDALATTLKEDTTLAACPTVFPLLTALINGKADGPSAKVKYPLQAWGERALLEAAILQIANNPSPVL
jgi:hypothetical protein